MLEEGRTVSNSLTVQYDRVMFVLEPGPVTNGLQRKHVTMFDYPDGTDAVKHQGMSLPYPTFDKVGNAKQADIVDNKRLGTVLSQAMQAELGAKRIKHAPSRRGQKQSKDVRFRKLNPAVGG